MRYILLLITFFIISHFSLGQDQGELKLDYRNPKVFEIAEIDITGSKYLDRNALVSMSSLKVGDKVKIPGEDISGAIKKLWKSGIIGNVAIYITKIESDKVFLNIDLKEKPRLTKIDFDGIGKSHQSELSDQVKLIRGRILDDVVLKNTELVVKKYFVEKGFLNTNVRILQKEDTLVSNGIQITVHVDKKDKVKIDRINFYGNEQFEDQKLAYKMKKTNEYLRFHVFKDLTRAITNINSKSAKKFATDSKKVDWKDIKGYFTRQVKVNFFRNSKFIKNEYTVDKKSVITYYNSKGYRDAQLLKDSIYVSGQNKISIDLYVEEGNRYYFRDIKWTGNFVYDQGVLNRVLGVGKGDVYNMELINKKLTFNPNGTDISALYMDNGYLAFQCTPVEMKIEQDSIDVEMRINEGRQFDVSKITITGNERTSDHVVFREIRTLPGQKFSRALLIRTQRELSQLGYFDPETIGINPTPNFADGTVDIEYSLTEKPSDQIELSGGWGGYYGFVGTVGLVFNNFSLRNVPHFDKWRPLPVGDGQKLQLRVQANGKQFQSYTFSFSEPWLGGRKPNALTVALQRSVQRTGTYGSVEYQGWFKLSGVSVSLGRRVRWPDDYFTLSNSLNFYVYDLENYGYSFGFSTGVSNKITFNTTIARNSIDSPMFPRSGSSITLGVELTPPYSTFNNIDYDNADNATKYKWMEYHKWMFDASYYLTLAGNLVLSTRAHFGFLGSYGVDIGPFERFSLGGDGLAGQNYLLGREIVALRGYENRSIEPYDRNGIQGGIAYNKFAFELRYPVSLNPTATIFVLTFAEAGNNFSNFDEYNPFNMYRSAGVGARVFMPAFGLLGVDWGYGFDTLPGKREVSGSQFHFSIGQQIR